MLDMFLDPHSRPFAIALAVVMGLFALEVLSSVMGISVLGAGSDGPDLDLDIDADVDFDMSSDFGLDTADFDIADLDAADATDWEAPDVSASSLNSPSSLIGWLGLREVPFLIWFVSLLTLFGLLGLGLQSACAALFDAPMPALLASVITLLPVLTLTRIASNWMALLMPKTETTAMRTRHLGGHRGTITQGTAMRGKPAEAKIKDRHGNIHYLRVEPLDDDAQFTQGADVTVIRKRGDRFYVI